MKQMVVCYGRYVRTAVRVYCYQQRCFKDNVSEYVKALVILGVYDVLVKHVGWSAVCYDAAWLRNNQSRSPHAPLNDPAVAAPTIQDVLAGDDLGPAAVAGSSFRFVGD